MSKSEREHNLTDKYNIGPAQYEHMGGYNKVIESAPAYNFGGKSQTLKYDNNGLPGPGSYEIEFVKSRKSIKFG